jgi:hypothetical protein
MKRGAERGRGVALAAERRRRAEKRQQAIDAEPEPEPEPEPEQEPLTRLQPPVLQSPAFGRRSPARSLFTPEPAPEPELEPGGQAAEIPIGQRRRDRRRQAVQPQDLAAINSALNDWRGELERQWDLGNISTREDAQASFLAHMEDAVRSFDLSQQRLAGLRIRRVRDQAERAMAEVVAARCADSTEATGASYAVMALVEDALAQLTDELTACAHWREARVEFLADLRKENHTTKARLARVTRVEVEESKAAELAEMTRRVEAERRVLSQEGNLSVEQMSAQLQKREQELLQRIKAAKQEEAAANAAAEAADNEIRAGFQRRMVQGLAGEAELAQSRAAQMEAAQGMRDVQTAIHDLKTKVAQLRNSNTRQQDKLARLEAERRRGFVPSGDGSSEKGSRKGGENNSKAIVKQRRELAINMEKGRRYAVEGSTDWEARAEHLTRRFNVPTDRAFELLRKYLGHAGLAASELEGVGGSVIDQDPTIDPNGTRELFNALDEDGSGKLA